MERIPVALGNRSYNILLARNALQQAGQHLKLNRRVLILTDTGVPESYAKTLAAQCSIPHIFKIPQGEKSKSLCTYGNILSYMLEHDFSRGDCVAAVGGGICGDLGGFVAASYMRGIDFYNIPTTVLAAVDSSVGGKTGVNLDGVKNIVGAFWQPHCVLIDADTLDTLPARQRANGLAEALKMAVVFDPALFAMFEAGITRDNIETVINRCVTLKKNIVEQDERESGARRLLNFGHTVGHGIEACSLDGTLLHGECIGIGMLPMCSTALRPRVAQVLQKLGLPTHTSADPTQIYAALRHDKKASGDTVCVVLADALGKGYLQQMSLQTLEQKCKEVCDI